MSESLWRYVGEASDGAIVRGRLNAGDRDAAAASLSAQGVAPISIKPAAGRFPLRLGRAPEELSQRAFADIANELAELAGAGVSLRDALELLADQTGDVRRRALYDRLLKRVRAGEPLSQAMRGDPAGAPRIMIAMAAAGEGSGDFVGAFRALAATLDASARLRRDLAGHLAYPAALFVLIGLTIVFLSYAVLPQFESIFRASNAAPPPETRVVLAVGAAVRAHAAYGPAYLLTALLIGRVVYALAKASIARLSLRLPFFGSTALAIDFGRFSRSLGAMLAGGAPLADALPIAREAVGNPDLSARLERASEAVRAGSSLAGALAAESAAPPEAIRLYEIGEASGALGAMATAAAVRLEEASRARLSRFSALLGPLLTAIMGLMTAAVIAAVMTGVLSLNDAVS